MTPIDSKKMESFLDKAVNDLGAAASAIMVLLGDQLGLYKALRDSGAATPEELAERTGTAERYIREWLCNQAAGGYLHYDPADGKFQLPPEQASALADEQSPYFLQGAFQILAAMFKAEPRILANFKSGEGLDWGAHDHRLFEGTERFFRPNYIANLVSSWIPALDGVEEKLKKGAKVADIGCGLGASTILMAQAFPNSRFYGFDYHPPSIQMARERAQQAQVADRITFEVATAADFPGTDYDLVTHFDCLHDMGDPIAAGRHVLSRLRETGTWMIVDPFANDRIEDNLTPFGRLAYAVSTCVCVPASLAQEGIALGAQAGEATLRAIVDAAGFNRFRRATATPFNLVLEAKK